MDKISRATTPGSGTVEGRRLEETRARTTHWRRWGPYLAERQWGTVREDYSAHGTAWEYFPHEHARSRAYRWGEDGIAGISRQPRSACASRWRCGTDAIRSSRSACSASPAARATMARTSRSTTSTSTRRRPIRTCERFTSTRRRRSRTAPSWRRTAGATAAPPSTSCSTPASSPTDRYFDVTVEYAKASAEDILIRITVANRGPEPAELHVLPTLWFRNTWSWAPGSPRPRLSATTGEATIEAEHAELGRRWLACEGDPELLFTENETNATAVVGHAQYGPLRQGRDQRLPRATGRKDAVNPEPPAPRLPPTTGSPSRPGRARRSACASATRAGRRRSAGPSTPCSRAGSARPTSSTRR